MSVSDFVGNFSKVNILANWLNEFFHEKTEATKRYAIITGSSGNGKSLLPKLLAEDFDTELFVISPIDIAGENDLYNVIKSINLQSFTHKQKIILIDDINEFSQKNRTKLCELNSIYPIIYTCETIANLDNEFTNGSLKHQNRIIKVKKPVASKLVEYLEKKSKEMNIDISDSAIQEIAQESKSVRSAELSLYTALTNELSKPYQSHLDILKSIKARRLNQSITRLNKHWIFNSIKGYDSNALALMQRFADFDYRIKVQFQDIEPYFVNNMIESIEKVVFEEHEFVFKNYKKKPKTKQEKEKKVVKQKVETSLSKWGF